MILRKCEEVRLRALVNLLYTLNSIQCTYNKYLIFIHEDFITICSKSSNISFYIIIHEKELYHSFLNEQNKDENNEKYKNTIESFLHIKWN